MPCSENGISVLATILFIVHPTKPIVRHEQLFDESNPYIKLGRNCVINDQVRVATHAKYPKSILGKSYMKVILKRLGYK